MAAEAIAVMRSAGRGARQSGNRALGRMHGHRPLRRRGRDRSRQVDQCFAHLTFDGIDQRTQITVVCGLRASDAVGHLDEFSQHRIHLLLMSALYVL